METTNNKKIKHLSNDQAVEIMHEFQQGNFTKAEVLLKECNRLVNFMKSTHGFKDMGYWTLDDLCMEAFETVWQKGQTFDESKAQFSTWFCTIVKNIYLKKYNKNKKRVEKEYLTYKNSDNEEQNRLDELDLGQSCEEKVLAEEAKRKMEAELLQLPENLRNAVYLRDIQGYKAGEAAKIIGCSSNNVSCWANRGIKKIGKKLHEEGYSKEDFGRD